MRLRGVKAALRYADRAGIDLVVIVGERERADDTVIRARHAHPRQNNSVAARRAGQRVVEAARVTLLRLALPSKGWEDDVLRFLGQCGLRVDRSNPRQYRARMRGLPTGPAEVVFQRATDIFDEVNAGSVDLGITGYDIVAEHRSDEDEILVVHGELGFRRCSLVVAVPEGWVDVTSVADLAEVAVELRTRRPRDARGDQVPQSGAPVPVRPRHDLLRAGRSQRRDRSRAGARNRRHHLRHHLERRHAAREPPEEQSPAAWSSSRRRA